MTKKYHYLQMALLFCILGRLGTTNWMVLACLIWAIFYAIAAWRS
jgi:hypothetical protein